MRAITRIAFPFRLIRDLLNGASFLLLLLLRFLSFSRRRRIQKKGEREKDSALRDRDKERTNVHGEEGNGTRQEKRAGR